MLEEIQGFLHPRHLPVPEGRPCTILRVSTSSVAPTHPPTPPRSAVVLTSAVRLSVQVPSELLWRQVSVFHATCGEASGRLQPHHSSGRGGRGAVVRVPHHHRPFAIAKVRKGLGDCTHNYTHT